MPNYIKIEVFPQGKAVIKVDSICSIYPSVIEGCSVMNFGDGVLLTVKGVPDQIAADIGIETEEAQRG